MVAKNRIISNKKMAEAFGGYDFRTSDMRKVCRSQDEISFKAGRQEVVDEINLYYNEGITLAQLFATNRWQSKLKEWGIEPQ